jgi:hypothetical protein
MSRIKGVILECGDGQYPKEYPSSIRPTVTELLTVKFLHHTASHFPERSRVTAKT